MRRALHILAAALAGASVFVSAKAQNAPASSLAAADAAHWGVHWGVIAECQMIVLPQKLALRLIPDLSDEGRIDAAWSKLQTMIGQDGVTLAANLIVRGDAGTRMITDSFEGVCYPSQFDPVNLPEEISGTSPVHALKNWPIVGATPVSFETRYVGPLLELETEISEDGQWVSANLRAQHVRFLKFAKIDIGVLASGEHVSVVQPYFSTMEETTALHLRPGQRVLLGIHKLPTGEEKMELFFLKIRTERIGGAK